MLKKLSNTFKVIIFIPLFIYFGKRSFIAFDEGYYILQAKWILSKGNWIAPLWFSDVALDRTIGIQFLIALSQKIFGKADFAIYLPITIASIFTAYLTYEIHKELIGDDFAIASISASSDILSKISKPSISLLQEYRINAKTKRPFKRFDLNTFKVFILNKF